MNNTNIIIYQTKPKSRAFDVLNNKFHKNQSGEARDVGLKVFPYKQKSSKESPEAQSRSPICNPIHYCI